MPRKTPPAPEPSYNHVLDNMPDTPEARARQNIDQLLTAAGWIVQSRGETKLPLAQALPDE